MKNILTSVLIIMGLGYTSAQRLPPKPPKPPLPKFLKNKKAKKARPAPPKPGERPYIITPDGQKLYPGDTPRRPDAPPRPPRPPRHPLAK
ncbi:hypothetical protein H1R16_08695 [Marnyiella aurantia]|uniref:Uncharacterized protein n=1 Tax=Marnyiella aurantia TaxID=2758037 RepID=A0A7D7LSG1_9FLAO|nr:hypothetical protein [Marnyiella aurantia]MBA5246860.1 hypothetical protein [Marnyiella aurantia]QMS97795.1 hypothetical protein H1R16_08695 [Marnyiella aurantia]